MHFIQHHIENQFLRLIAYFGVFIALLRTWNTNLVSTILDGVRTMDLTDIATAFSLSCTGLYYGVRAFVAFRKYMDERKQQKSSIIITEDEL